VALTNYRTFPGFLELAFTRHRSNSEPTEVEDMAYQMSRLDMKCRK
jgi:hypothetical protein